MVDVARLVAVNARVYHRLGVHREQKRMVVVGILVLVTRVGLRVAHAIAQVLDDGRALADAARGEHSVPMDGGMPHFEQGSTAATRRFLHIAMGALMAG